MGLALPTAESWLLHCPKGRGFSGPKFSRGLTSTCSPTRSTQTLRFSVGLLGENTFLHCLMGCGKQRLSLDLTPAPVLTPNKHKQTERESVSCESGLSGALIQWQASRLDPWRNFTWEDIFSSGCTSVCFCFKSEALTNQDQIFSFQV